jgi:uncharacterized membrane protein
MKWSAYALLFISIFGFLVAIVYWFTSYEPSGTVMIVAFGLMGLLPGSYMLWWSRRMDPAPNDNPEAKMADYAGPVQAFPATSVWPVTLGLGLALTAIAFVFGVWTAVVGMTLVVAAVLGVIAESRRGGTV